MNQTVKFGKQRLERCYASVVCTYATNPMKSGRPVRRAGAVDVKSSSERR